MRGQIGEARKFIRRLAKKSSLKSLVLLKYDTDTLIWKKYNIETLDDVQSRINATRKSFMPKFYHKLIIN